MTCLAFTLYTVDMVFGRLACCLLSLVGSNIHTSDHLSVARAVSSGDEDNIPSTGVGIVVLEKEDLVDPVVL